MNLNEFFNFRKNCLVCNGRNLMTMMGTMQEEIDDSLIHCIFNYMIPVLRKDFMTFASASIAIFSPSELLDVETLNNEKYKTFLINKDGYVSFDYNFKFKMKMNFRVFCPEGHYSYDSRTIRISNKSPDITKGYPIAAETLTHDKYKVVSNHMEKETAVFNESSKNPVVIPYMDIASFPYDDPEKFVKKVQNILLLA